MEMSGICRYLASVEPYMLNDMASNVEADSGSEPIEGAVQGEDVLDNEVLGNDVPVEDADESTATTLVLGSPTQGSQTVEGSHGKRRKRRNKRIRKRAILKRKK